MEWCRGVNSYGFYHTVGACRWEWDSLDTIVPLTCEEAK